MRTEKEVLSEFKKWAKEKDFIRAAILTSSRVKPDAEIDFLSDYDIELYVSDLSIFKKDDSWLEPFGPIMVRWPYKPRSTGFKPGNWITRLILFKDGVRIDFQITDQQQIKPDAYDNGYKVLIDKDQLTCQLTEPTYSEYIINKPGKEEYETLVNEFWWNAYYVPKYLWRDEITYAKYMLDNILRYSYLHKIIDWYIGLENDWSVETGALGKNFKDYLRPEIWADLEETYTGADITANWKAFIKMTDIFRRLAEEVGQELGYKYPVRVDQEVMEFCKSIFTCNG
ncbi:aminoglycoside 6-adenylyltransferase [Halanaerobiaceae bacterium Z-7014]|uniref:Aminoglycoside 6-adenylyltransferase n=1 Tax=Halonatronomonas betaini TaxID=2778430 RepID=A0A931ATK3_9FIRM|nr:aminoglycoside 6-adenylyltransferase [Halonatronomonas betaini]MBF8436190.1 aminoglycoside 6-adenylyltransferase [Halonatronomonas betaini]